MKACSNQRRGDREDHPRRESDGAHLHHRSLQPVHLDAVRRDADAARESLERAADGALRNDPNVVVVQTSDIFAYRDRLSPDRFHPSGEGYGLIARRIADSF
jgi:lysophospholipase L1-like esterase